LKRQLWAQLLKLVYGREVESDPLFFQHTFLVVVAKAIALAVLDMNEDDPARILSGRRFEASGILGAVESDFFDWIIADPEGIDLVRRIVTHVRRFKLRDVESDILKILYESLIDRDERRGLGEYYTPDWLAAKIVRNAVSSPHEQRVLDPACGSGTFLFHAVRHYLKEADDIGVPLDSRAAEATALVTGLDIHPVAVIIARVTYLLALAPALQARKGAISIPVYLGDALQLSIRDTMGMKELSVAVPPDASGEGAAKLDFPETFCRDPALFDKSVESLRTSSESKLNRPQIEARLTQIVREHYKRELTKEEKEAVTDLGATYLVFDQLRKSGRDSVWTYVARNLSRPLALSFNNGWANVVVGNPPWVSFRNMSPDLQKRFREMSKAERVYVGGKFATQSDLSALFTVRVVALYLRSGGRIAFVLPHAALTRGQFERLRAGSFSSARIAWDEVWTMDESVWPLFPVPSCVVFGRRRATSRAIPDVVRAYSGHLPYRDAHENIADQRLTVTENAPRPTEGRFTGGSAYRNSFRQGATLVPRMLCLVERKSMGRIGGNLAAPLVVSRRTPQEKKPWRDLPGVERSVEAQFLRPVLLGESILPFRVFRPFEGVVPVSNEGAVLDSNAAANRGYAGLHDWMRDAEAIWNANAESGSMTLVERWNYHNELGSQFPLDSLRVVYAASGTIPAACLLHANNAVIEHKLYWFSPSTESEAYFLVSILNSEAARARIASLQSRGQWGARDFDKVIFTLPIPRFDEADQLHVELARAGRAGEDMAASIALPEGVKFQRARRLVRDALTEAGVSTSIDELVAHLLDGEL